MSARVAPSERRRDIVLVVPPFAHVAFPALGPSLLVAGCRHLGLRAEVLHANLQLAARTSYELCCSVALSSRESLLGERLFAPHAFPGWRPAAASPPSSSREPRADGPVAGPPPTLDRAALDRLEGAIPGFLEDATARILERSPTVVGFSSSFQQNLCSVALARRLKQERPAVITVLGGANATEPMGPALAELTSSIDHVIAGPADLVFPQLCRDLLEGGAPFPERVITCPPLPSLDRAMVPDYSDYLEQLEALVAEGAVPPSLPECLHFEASRGCWWGERSHCAFCGLNTSQMTYRAKSADRVVDEMETLARAHGVRSLYATDNLISPVFRREVVPVLAASQDRYTIFCEVRPDMDEDELGLFAAAGVTFLQPGIESLSTHVLRLLGKGTTGPRNLTFLRDCASWQIRLAWNLLLGVPGEQRRDYRQTLRLLPLIEHLEPPSSWGPIRIDRFSRYHENPEVFGLRGLRPAPAAAEAYPPQARLDDLAYHFVADYTTELLEDRELLADLGSALRQWSRAWRAGSPRPRLQATALTDELLLIEDTRSCAAERYFVAAADALSLLRRLARPTARWRLADGEGAHLSDLLGRGLVVEHEDLLLALVTTRRPLPQPLPAAARAGTSPMRRSRRS